jgi:two-component sensor histidine kinase
VTASLELTFVPLPASVTAARKRVAEYAGEVGADRDAVELAVCEGVGNAVMHAFEGRSDGTIAVRAWVEGDSRLVVEVADDGSGINPDVRTHRAGFGLPIVGGLTESLEVHSGASGTRLVMRFPRGG